MRNSSGEYLLHRRRESLYTISASAIPTVSMVPYQHFLSINYFDNLEEYLTSRDSEIGLFPGFVSCESCRLAWSCIGRC